MKGVILAGGLGTRLRPLTNTRNKHTLDVGGRSMIDYPTRLLVAEGITDIAYCLNGPYGRQIEEVIGDGSRLGCTAGFFYKEAVGGPGRSLAEARSKFSSTQEDIAVLFGDGIFFAPLKLRGRQGPHMYLMDLPPGGADSPDKYAQACVKGDRVLELVEKPSSLLSTLVQAGAFVFGPDVFGVIDALQQVTPPNVEIGLTDINVVYAKQGRLTYSLIEPHSYIDCGTPEALREASERATYLHKVFG